jgi:two-component system, OmpR family, response regulator
VVFCDAIIPVTDNRLCYLGSTNKLSVSPLIDGSELSAIRGAERRPLLLVEDEAAMAWEIENELESLGYSVKVVATESAALQAGRLSDAALLIVDRMLGGADGLSIVERLRREGIRTPVLFISALATVDERIRGLQAGGDDYLTKPFAMTELAARVEALLRRSDDRSITRLLVGSLEIDLIARTARRSNRDLDLCPTEFKLLEYFMRRPGRTITRTMLLQDIWHYRNLPQTNLVDVHVGKLRRKMDAAGEPSLIRSVRRSGFVFDVDADR